MASVVGIAFWRALEIAATEGGSFIFFLFMARLLSPDEFGLVAISGSVILVLQSIVIRGLPDALIQLPTLDKRTYEAASNLNLAIGLGLIFLVLAVAWPLSMVLNRTEVPWILIALSSTLPVQALTATLSARLRRRFEYRPIAIRAWCATLLGGAAGLVAAHFGASYWSLVIQQTVTAISGLVALTSVGDKLPAFSRPRSEHLAELLAVARPVMKSALVATAARRLDAPILALYMSNSEVGIYFLVSRLIFSVQMMTQYSISELALPTLARLQDDKPRLRAASKRVLRVTGASCGLFFGALAFGATFIIPILFGRSWEDAVWPLQALAFAMPFAALGSVSVSIILATGAAARSARIAMTISILPVLAMAAMGWAGLPSLSLFLGAVFVLTALPALRGLSTCLQISPMTVARDIAPIMLVFVIGACGSLGIARSGWAHADAVACAVFSVFLLGSYAYLLRNDLRGVFRTSLAHDES